MPMPPVNLDFQFIGTEGDVARMGNRIFGPILPFLNMNGPAIVQRSESGPPGTTQARQNVDSPLDSETAALR
jgi:hypothetical protein